MVGACEPGRLGLAADGPRARRHRTKRAASTTDSGTTAGLRHTPSSATATLRRGRAPRRSTGGCARLWRSSTTSATGCEGGIVPSRVTFGEYAETWFDAQTQIGPRTRDAYRGDHAPDLLRRQHVERLDVWQLHERVRDLTRPPRKRSRRVEAVPLGIAVARVRRNEGLGVAVAVHTHHHAGAAVARFGEILGMHRGMHHPSIAGTPDTHDPLNQAVSAWPSGSEWAVLGSNQQPLACQSCGHVRRDDHRAPLLSTLERRTANSIASEGVSLAVSLAPCECGAAVESETVRFAGPSGLGREGFEPSTLGLRVPCSTN